jgi:hypothetical protein
MVWKRIPKGGLTDWVTGAFEKGKKSCKGKII